MTLFAGFKYWPFNDNTDGIHPDREIRLCITRRPPIHRPGAFRRRRTEKMDMMPWFGQSVRGASRLKKKVRKSRPLRLRFLGVLLRVIRGLGINIDLIVLEREGAGPVDFTPPENDFTCRFLGPKDIQDLLRLDAKADRDSLESMFRDEKLCFGMWDDARLVAKMWCDPHELYHPVSPKQLDADEVYLQLAFVDPDYRGQNLAPLMRVRGYAALRELGMTKFYSYSMYVNAEARRFKAKLGARSECLIVFVRWFGRWSSCRTYSLDG